MIRGVPRRQLASIVREHGTLDVADAVDIALDICDALTPLHAHGVVHGDLRADHILVPWPRTEAAGVAEIFAVDSRDEGASGAGFFDAGPGQVARDRAAPEQRDSTAPVDARADIWAVGALMQRMLAGAHDIPSVLAHVVQACLATDPARRPQTIDDLAERLASFSSSPVARYERLADRRAASVVARAAVTEPRARDALNVLDRLDDAAIGRELSATRAPSMSVIAVRPTPILPPRSIEVAALAPLSSLADEISEERVACSVSPSIAPVLLSTPPAAKVAADRAFLGRLPLLAYAAALAVSAVLGFRFARSHATPADAHAVDAPPPVLTGVPAAVERPEPAPTGVVAVTPATKASSTTMPHDLPDAPRPTRPLRAVRAAMKASSPQADPPAAEPTRVEDWVLQDTARR